MKLCHVKKSWQDPPSVFLFSGTEFLIFLHSCTISIQTSAFYSAKGLEWQAPSARSLPLAPWPGFHISKACVSRNNLRECVCRRGLGCDSTRECATPCVTSKTSLANNTRLRTINQLGQVISHLEMMKDGEYCKGSG